MLQLPWCRWPATTTECPSPALNVVKPEHRARLLWLHYSWNENLHCTWQYWWFKSSRVWNAIISNLDWVWASTTIPPAIQFPLWSLWNLNTEQDWNPAYWTRLPRTVAVTLKSGQWNTWCWGFSSKGSRLVYIEI